MLPAPQLATVAAAAAALATLPPAAASVGVDAHVNLSRTVYSVDGKVYRPAMLLQPQAADAASLVGACPPCIGDSIAA